MDKTQALKLVREQRDRWPSQGADEFIARRARRGYRKMAIVFAVIALLEAAIAAKMTIWPVYIPALGFLIGAGIWEWQSRRFDKVLKALRS
jgi:hypothetical protein